MSIASEIARLQSAKADLATSIANKGVTVPANATLDDYAALVDSIQQGGSSLPYDAEVEYLQGDGNAAISTVSVNGNIYIKIHLVDYFTSAFSSEWAFGGRTGSYSNMFGISINGNSNKINFNYNTRILAFDQYNTYPASCDVEINNGTFKIGTTSHTYSKESFSSTYKIWLFGLNNGGSLILNTAKIGSCYISNGTTVMDLIPVRKNGVGYFYDRITRELKGNETGSGAFIIGPDVV